MKKLNIKKSDIAVLAVSLIILAAVLLLRDGSNAITAEVSINGKTLYSIELDKITQKKEIELENGVKIAVEPDKIYFVYSPCDGKDCIKFGELSKAGQTAVCVPEKTVIVLLGNNSKNTPDAISY